MLMNNIKVIYAHGVHTGGGLTLLRSVLEKMENRPGFKIILDTRVRCEISQYDLVDVEYFNPGILGRIFSEFKIHFLGSKVSKILTFNSIPFLLPINKNATLFFQNVNLIDPGDKPTFLSLLKSKMFKFSASRVDEYIAQSASVQKLLKSVTDRPCTIMTLLDESVSPRFTPARIDSSAINTSTNFIYVADDSYHKNHKILFEAWSLLKEALPEENLNLYITIPKRDGSPFGRFSGQYDFERLSIYNLGHLERTAVFEWYKSCDALVFPSLKESLGLPLLEAQSTGLDIIASELDYVRDVCCPIESFNPTSSLSLARALARYCQLELPHSIVPTDVSSFIDIVFEGNS